MSSNNQSDFNKTVWGMAILYAGITLFLISKLEFKVNFKQDAPLLYLLISAAIALLGIIIYTLLSKKTCFYRLIVLPAFCTIFSILNIGTEIQTMQNDTTISKLGQDIACLQIHISHLESKFKESEPNNCISGEDNPPIETDAAQQVVEPQTASEPPKADESQKPAEPSKSGASTETAPTQNTVVITPAQTATPKKPAEAQKAAKKDVANAAADKSIIEQVCDALKDFLNKYQAALFIFLNACLTAAMAHLVSLKERIHAEQ